MFLIGQFLQVFYSEAAWSNGLKHGRKDKMSNPYREPSIDASYQVSVHKAVSEEKIFRNQPIRN
jgi:hypothetical protein